MQKYIIYRPTLILLLVEHYKAERISSHFPIYGHEPVKILNNELLLQSSGNYDIVLKILGIESESLKYFEANEIFAEHILELVVVIFKVFLKYYFLNNTNFCTKVTLKVSKCFKKYLNHHLLYHFRKIL
jgi:hypothetical protein